MSEIAIYIVAGTGEDTRISQVPSGPLATLDDAVGYVCSHELAADDEGIMVLRDGHIVSCWGPK